MDREEWLEQENRRLLDELAQAYEKMEVYLVAARDEQDVAYGELQDRNRRLESQLRELEEAHSALKEAENLLIYSERLAAMGQLAASLAHEIRNPLSVIRGRVQLMTLNGRGDAELRKNCEIINSQISRLAKLLDDALLFARRQDSELSILDVNAVIEDLLTFVGRLVDKGMKISLSLQAGIPAVSADANALQQVFLNLILNAADAMDDGGSLQVATSVATMDEWIARHNADGAPVGSAVSECDREAEHVCTEFRDGGRGMPAEALDVVFNPFFTTKAEGKGTGLGLTICRTIVERYRGNILVSSRPEAGTTFGVFLPSCA